MQAGSLIHACWWLVKRDLLLVFRHRSDAANPLLFFLMVTVMFPIGIGPDPATLRLIAPGVIWVAALLATLVSAEAMFRSDFDDGSLEQLVLSPHPLPVLMGAKVFAHWLITGLPLLLLAPLLALMFGLSVSSAGTLMLTLLLGTPALSLVGAIGVGLTVGLRRGGILLALLLLPLYVPILIFATGAIVAEVRQLPSSAHLYMLSAILTLSATLAPLATALAVRIRMN
jgi:heme exporter protein B